MSLMVHYLVNRAKFGILGEGDIEESTEGMWSMIDAIGEAFDKFDRHMREDDFDLERYRHQDLTDCESSGTDLTFNSPSESEIIDSDHDDEKV